jgi:hypothetical protein
MVVFEETTGFVLVLVVAVFAVAILVGVAYVIYTMDIGSLFATEPKLTVTISDFNTIPSPPLANKPTVLQWVVTNTESYAITEKLRVSILFDEDIDNVESWLIELDKSESKTMTHTVTPERGTHTITIGVEMPSEPEIKPVMSHHQVIWWSEAEMENVKASLAWIDNIWKIYHGYKPDYIWWPVWKIAVEAEERNIRRCLEYFLAGDISADTLTSCTTALGHISDEGAIGKDIYDDWYDEDDCETYFQVNADYGGQWPGAGTAYSDGKIQVVDEVLQVRFDLLDKYITENTAGARRLRTAIKEDLEEAAKEMWEAMALVC